MQQDTGQKWLLIFTLPAIYFAVSFFIKRYVTFLTGDSINSIALFGYGIVWIDLYRIRVEPVLSNMNAGPEYVRIHAWAVAICRP